MQSISKLRSILSDARIFWKTPPKGKYINYRSIFSYSVGGIGVYVLMHMFNTINVTGTNVVIANATGLDPSRHLLPMYYATFIISILSTGIRAKMVDNARNKKGKYRPYIMSMGVPTAILSCVIVWFPYQKIESRIAVWIIVFVLMSAYQFFYYFLYEAYENLIFVMSPNTQERSDVTAIKSVVYSIAPTVMVPLAPLIQKWIGATDLYDIRIYQIMFPVAAVISIAFAILTFSYTEEKIIQAKTHVTQIRFMDALRAVAKNKYFWIISLAGWIGFLETTQGYIFNWLYNYAGMCSEEEYALMMIIYGNASLWGMIAAPIAIRFLGKKKTLIITNAFNVLFIALMYPSINIAKSMWLVLLCLYLNGVVGAFSHILTPSLNADIRDYQHYVSGERIDGMFAAVGLIGSFIGILNGTIAPAIFDRYGVNDHNGYANAYDILKYEPDTLFNLINLLIMLSIIGAALNVGPYFFYDLSEQKQKGMVRILKVRALFEDYGNNSLNDAELVEAVDLVRRAKEYAAFSEKHGAKEDLLKVKKSGDKAEIRAARKKLREERDFNEEIAVSKMVVAELEKFSRRSVQVQLSHAQKLYAGGLQSILTYPDSVLHNARALPKNTAEEKEIRSYAIDTAKNIKIGKRCALKHFKDGIPQYDYSVLSDLYAKEDELEEKLQFMYKEKYSLKETGRGADKKEECEAIDGRIKQLRAEKRDIEKRIKEQGDHQANCARAGKAYFDAEKLIKQEKNYNHFSDIEALYDDARRRHEEKLLREREEEEKLEAERRAEKEALKAQKKSGK